MRVLYDHQAFTMQYFGGVSKCFCELISHLPHDIDSKIGIVESNNHHLIASNICPNIKPVSYDIHTFASKYKFKGKGTLYALTNKLLPFLSTTENKNKRESVRLLKEGHFDVFHPTFFDDYFVKHLNGKPFVLTIHDMMPELFPKYFKKNDVQIVLKKKLINNASAIIAVSEQTKKDIINLLDVSSDKIEVIYHGGPIKEIITEKSPYNFPYFLYVGQRWGYKNFKQLLEDFAAFVVNNKHIKLICTGSAFTQEEEYLIKKLNLTENVLCNNASNYQLKLLYANAIAFIYPSLYEGFGLPILEAFAYGCPVLLNNKSCFPEIAANAATYFISDDTNSNITKVMNEVIHWSKEERKNIIEMGYERLNIFSWEKSAKQLSMLYQNII